MSDCGNCKHAPICAIKKGVEVEMTRIINHVIDRDIRDEIRISIECKHFEQDKDPNIPDRFQ